MTDLKVFDQLAADITVFVAPTLQIAVVDDATSANALEVAKDVKGFLSQVEKKRKELVGPLNDRVRAINDYCKQITAPLDNADSHIRSQLNAYAAEQLKVRRAEEDRIRKEAEEIERKAREERARLEAELLAKQEAEAEAQAEAAAMFGVEGGDVDQMHAEIAAKQEREQAEQKAELDRQEAMRRMELQQRQFDAKQVGIKNTRATQKVRVLDIAQIPKEFLIVTANEKAILAAMKAGVKIAGVELYEEISVPIGSKTRVPRIG